MQLVVVALPEELFFRGCLHRLLEERFPPTRRWLGGGLGVALLLSSLAFALVHLPKNGDPRALATFFPGLLFGWMRSATGSIMPSVLVHAVVEHLGARPRSDLLALTRHLRGDSAVGGCLLAGDNAAPSRRNHGGARRHSPCTGRRHASTIRDLAALALAGAVTTASAAHAETVRGTLTYTDGDGTPTPIRRAKVEIQQMWAGDNSFIFHPDFVATTNEAGFFSATIPFRETGVRYRLRVFATNPAVQVWGVNGDRPVDAP